MPAPALCGTRPGGAAGGTCRGATARPLPGAAGGVPGSFLAVRSECERCSGPRWEVKGGVLFILL